MHRDGSTIGIEIQVYFSVTNNRSPSICQLMELKALLEEFVIRKLTFVSLEVGF